MVQRASSSLPKSAPQRGFTLVELLVVIAIIAILIGLAVVIASKVSGSGKQRQTEQTLRLLDSVLAAYTHATGSIPPATVLDPRVPSNAPRKVIPILEGMPAPNGDPATDPVLEKRVYMNTVGMFLLQCKSVPEAAKLLEGVDAKILREYDPAPAGAPGAGLQPPLLTAFDGWGHPIRYVHPASKGLIIEAGPPMNPLRGNLVENVLGKLPTGSSYQIPYVHRATNYNSGQAPTPNGTATPLFAGLGPEYVDSDCGIPTDNRPYFYSAGPDGDPGTVEDNIYYPTRPKFPKK